ncbi:uroporphyrinogen-III C-methyltransferase [Kocuria indica]|uniref:uroporphyrinogen-III C-methyltransferase n=1 Tax=Kocuria marina TaxID=223184 RepID=UPI001EF673F2|nr:uroporphyrinogen-III C-methyltransferase [Kocuria indica]MCG7432516.1 uroporphyrinogen-III C-methyltransferase [Kocuria indica]
MTYPLGLNLAGRAVLVVGGGSDAARRTRSLLAEGALVDLVAPDLHDTLRDLTSSPGLTWHERAFRPDDLDGAWLVFLHVSDSGERERVALAAEERRVLCVADDAAPGPDRAADTRAPVTQVPVTETRVAQDRVFQAPVTQELGTVALVGGGPGDPGLLTVRGRQLLADADVIVADRLGPTDLLPELARHARIIDVGKRAGYHKYTQDRINETLVEQAKLGLRVVRLKGGDPYVFGRGGEEVEFCRAHGVATQVVPGVTSAISVPAAAGIPVTHRDMTHGFTVITAHQQLRHVPYRDGHTLILMMGVRGLEHNAELLMAAGYPADTPVAVVERGWTPTQRTTVAQLDTIARVAREREVTAPAVIVVGRVAALAQKSCATPGPQESAQEG